MANQDSAILQVSTGKPQPNQLNSLRLTSSQIHSDITERREQSNAQRRVITRNRIKDPDAIKSDLKTQVLDSVVQTILCFWQINDLKSRTFLPSKGLWQYILELMGVQFCTMMQMIAIQEKILQELSLAVLVPARRTRSITRHRHLRRILEKIRRLRSSRNTTSLCSTDAVVRGIQVVVELRASLERAEGNNGEDHFWWVALQFALGKSQPARATTVTESKSTRATKGGWLRTSNFFEHLQVIRP